MIKLFATIIEIVKIFLIALVIVIPIRYFLFQPFFVVGASMEPNFSQGEYLLIDEISYRFKNPQRGEVVVFKYSKDATSFYIKRIIGLPGETIEIKNNKVKIYNLQFPAGQFLNESYIEDLTQGNLKISLKKNEYFVLGDNRDHSSDSRSWGPASKESIVGKVWFSLFPSKGIQLLSAPQY